jgi:hypothetical protein
VFGIRRADQGKRRSRENSNYWNEDRDQLPARSEPRHPPLDAPPADQLALVLQFARAEKSPATCRAYRSDFTTLVLIDARHLLARAVFRAAIRRGGNND